MARIAHLTTVHQRHDVRIFKKECRSLAQSGYEVHLFVADGRGDEQTDGVQIHDIGEVTGRFKRMLIQPWRMWRAARRTSAKIYHFHDPELLPVGLMLKLSGAQVIYDAHEDVPRAVMSKYWIKPWLRKLVSAGFERFENFAASRLSAVAAATPHIADRFRRIQRRSIAINNYPLESELQSESAPQTSTRRVCYVGGIGLIRGAVEMITAMESVDARLILAGPFESEATEVTLRGLPGWEKVDYRGIVSREAVQRIFSESRAGLLFFHPEPNHVDAQPNKMFEYMSAGLPVLASNFPLWRALLEDIGAGICVDPLNPKEIARVINDVLDDPRRSAAMGARGREAVANRFQWQFEEKKLDVLYSELASAR